MKIARQQSGASEDCANAIDDDYRSIASSLGEIKSSELREFLRNLPYDARARIPVDLPPSSRSTRGLSFTRSSPSAFPTKHAHTRTSVMHEECEREACSRQDFLRSRENLQLRLQRMISRSVRDIWAGSPVTERKLGKTLRSIENFVPRLIELRRR